MNNSSHAGQALHVELSLRDMLLSAFTPPMSQSEKSAQDFARIEQ